MADTRTTNEKIVGLLLEQTYAERIEMARWFSDVLNDKKAELSSGEGFSQDDLALLFESWADSELEDEGP